VNQPNSGGSAERRQLPLASAGARWLIAAAVLGSGIALLDGTVVNVALPTIGQDLDADLTGQQWVLDGYLLTLSALLLSGGAAGDRYGHRRVFVAGLVVFTAASLACGLAPSIGWLIGARLVQGVGAAALVPGSLALIDAGIVEADRARAIGIWAGMSGVTTALGPFIGGWLVEEASWRCCGLPSGTCPKPAVQPRHVARTSRGLPQSPLAWPA
jgi:MFS family permease